MSEIPSAARLSRRLFLGALLGSAATRVLANPPASSMRPVPRADPEIIARARVPSLERLVRKAGLSGKMGFAVADAQTGEMLEGWSPLLALPPASVAKAITAQYALDRLGADHRFTTRLIAAGPVSEGRLDGDLVLVGGGNPTLNTRDMAAMADALKETGLREITGAFRVTSGALPTVAAIDPDQAEHLAYNPSVSGLNLNFNRIHFEWKREKSDYTVELDAPSGSYSPVVAMARMEVVNRKGPVYTYEDTGTVEQWTVARRALGKKGSRWLPVRKPLAHAADVFRTLARSHGIVLPDATIEEGPAAPPDGTVLVAHDSDPLIDILREMLRWSTNLTAEVVGMAATVAGGKTPASLEASAAAMTEWAETRLGLRKARFVDHSGLGAASQISAAEMVQALVRLHATDDLAAILKAIPMRNSDGETVPNHPVKVRAKTGTLHFVSALAGYMTAEDGRPLAFAIFTSDLPRRERTRLPGGERPEGAASWTARSRTLQRDLLARWGTLYKGQPPT